MRVWRYDPADQEQLAEARELYLGQRVLIARGEPYIDETGPKWEIYWNLRARTVKVVKVTLGREGLHLAWRSRGGLKWVGVESAELVVPEPPRLRPYRARRGALAA